ncbi:FAD-dependent oxidoreductase [Candidatus Kaiserbacteria bacterium]|nr:FAD-dependent oxidoreductase [Candidatus Kaiserbacteria bacterium]
MENDRYDIVIVGGGVSGTALLYALSHYTDIQRIALIEKYHLFGQVNSHAKNNSQTLHMGDIETNYSAEKARQVRGAAGMVKRYTETLPPEERDTILRRVQKMVLAVGQGEVETLEKRHDALKEIFPELQKLDAHGIAEAEPEVMRGRDPHELVLGLCSSQGYAVDFGLLARSFARRAQEAAGNTVNLLLGHTVEQIERRDGVYILNTDKGPVRADIVVVNADAHSLGFAKSLGYGKEFSLIPIAGSFYFTPQKLRGKVYRVQDPRMPFAAVHGDPDLTAPGLTRWGPTARFYPALEAGKLSTMRQFFSASGMHRIATWASFGSILLDPLRFWYLLRNFFYDLPVIGTYFLLPQLRKIVPTLRGRDVRRARGYGGMRLQRVDTRTRELLLGEGKIIGDKIIFNMSPSPGASVCLYNAMRDAEAISGFFPDEDYHFDKARMARDLCEEKIETIEDPSLYDTYAS